MNDADSILKILENNPEIKFVDLCFTDIQGEEHRISVSVDQVKKGDFFTQGIAIDGSSITGWKCINDSDIYLIPDARTVFIDPLPAHRNLVIRCGVVDQNYQEYDHDPRCIAKYAEKYLLSEISDAVVYFGVESEFFIRNQNILKSNENSYLSRRHDASYELRTRMCTTMLEMGLVIEKHHHERAPDQNEIVTRFTTLTKKADEMQTLKYVVETLAQREHKIADFGPKPFDQVNGSGMHCHISLSSNGTNLFYTPAPSKLSETALYFIGGIKKHAAALCAFTNPTSASYKRLVPGYEAPVLVAYSFCNRSAAIRIPAIRNPQESRLEVRFPDSSCNPYLAFSALLMAGIDGITGKISAGQAEDRDLYTVSEEEKENISALPVNLTQAINALKEDNKFLQQGGVFSQAFINSYIDVVSSVLSSAESAV